MDPKDETARQEGKRILMDEVLRYVGSCRDRERYRGQEKMGTDVEVKLGTYSTVARCRITHL